MSNQDQALIVLEAWDITIPPAAEAAKAAAIAKLDAADIDGPIPVNAVGQEIAQQMVQAESEVKAFMAEVDRVSKELRQPYFDHAKKIKATSDTFLLDISNRLCQLDRKLGEYEAEKQRIQIRLEQQRREEEARLRREEELRQRAAEDARRRQEFAERQRLAEIERQKQAEQDLKRKAELEAREVAERKRQAEEQAKRDQERQAEQQRLLEIVPTTPVFETPKTEGVTVRTVWEFDIEDPLKLALWCRENGRAWLNKERLADCFFKRDITEAINAPDADRNIPGLRCRQVVATNVRKAKGPKTINVRSTVEL